MSKYRLISMLFYGAAALVGSALMLMMGINPLLAVTLPFAVAAGADRFVNHEAEPDERMRSFVIYTIGAVGGLLLILMFGSSLGWWRWLTPLVGFTVLALVDYFVPPAGYQPRDPHRYGESPPVTVRQTTRLG